MTLDVINNVPYLPRGDTQFVSSQDTWRTERSGHIVKEHRLPRRAKFVPTGSDCPVRVDKLTNYRRTVIHRNGVTHEVLVDALRE